MSPAPCSGNDETSGGDRSGRSRIFDGASGKPLFSILGQNRKDSLGTWVTPIGDVDGNSKADLRVTNELSFEADQVGPRRRG